MASMWRKAMHYLGLGPDDEYEDDLGYGDVEPTQDRSAERSGGAGAARAARPAARPAVPPPPPASTGSVSRLDPAPSAGGPGGGRPGGGASAGGGEPASLRPLPPPPREAPGRSSGAVRTIAAVARVSEVAPSGFNDAQQVGDRFKAGSAVAMDLGGVDRELARRLIDFCSGLCYALGGKMERLGGQSYLIIPSGVEVSSDDRRRLAGGEA